MLGTNPYPFVRLMDRVIKWVEETGERVVVQSGNTPVTNDKIEAHPFMDHSRILSLMQEADVVITQGGFGGLQDCIRVGARTIAVPRMVELGESTDDQIEIVNALAEENLIIPLYDVEELADAIELAKNMNIESTTNYELPRHIATTITGFLRK